MKDKVKCKTPGCSNTSITRGLCAYCYNVANRMVNRREVSWEALEKAGRVLKSKKEIKSIAKQWFTL